MGHTRFHSKIQIYAKARLRRQELTLAGASVSTEAHPRWGGNVSCLQIGLKASELVGLLRFTHVESAVANEKNIS